MILAEEKKRHHDSELQSDSSAGTNNLEQHDAYGGEELEKIAVSRKPFRELSCNSNVSANLEPDDDREVLRRIVCVNIRSPGELNGQMTVLKEYVKARYILWDPIRAQKNEKMASSLSGRETRMDPDARQGKRRTG